MVRDDDDTEPRKPAGFQPLVLESLSIGELTAYIAALRAEIARVEADIATKRNVRAGAESFFRK